MQSTLAAELALYSQKINQEETVPYIWPLSNGKFVLNHVAFNYFKHSTFSCKNALSFLNMISYMVTESYPTDQLLKIVFKKYLTRII